MTRPSLLQTAESSQNVNVLDAIHDPVAAARQRSPARRRMVWAIVPFAVAGLWLALADSATEPVGAQVVVTSAPADSLKVAVAAAPVVVDPIAVASAHTSTTHPPKDVTSPKAQADAPGAAPFQALAAPSLALAPSEPPKRSARVAAAPVPNVKPASVPKSPANTAAASRPKAEKNTRPAPKATARAPAAAVDPDVELLSALMQHMGGVKPKALTNHTLAERVSECRRKGQGDVTSCQRRVCAGAWGQEKSCPAHLAPDQNTRESATPG